MEREKQKDKLPEHLRKLLDFICGKGEFWWTGNAIHTHPGHDDNQDKIYAACEELEKRGLVKRRKEEPGHVVFVGVDK